MGTERPPDFSDVATARQRVGQMSNVIGVVTDILPPRKSMGADWMFTFSLDDGSGCPQKVKYFEPSEKTMPPIQGPGDVVVLRQVKAMIVRGETVLISRRSTTWTIYHQDAIPAKPPIAGASIKHVRSPLQPVPQASETRYVIDLKTQHDPGLLSAPSNQVTSESMMKPRQKFSLVKSVCSGNYYDLIGQAVKLYSNGDRLELYFSDYTSNDGLFDYLGSTVDEEDSYGLAPQANHQWRGPIGKRTLFISLFPPHSYWATSHLREDDYVSIQNVHVKHGREGYTALEGVLHTDKRHEDRIHISKLEVSSEDDRLKDVLRRKRDYEKQMKAEGKLPDEPRGQKRAIVDVEEGKLDKPSRGAKRRAKKQNAKKDQTDQTAPKAIHAQSNSTNDTYPTPKSHPCSPTSPSSATEPSLRTALRTPNANIKTKFPNQPILSLASILSTESSHAYTTAQGNACTLPFQNTTSRATVRVLDFKPARLADFALRKRVRDYDVLSDASSEGGEMTVGDDDGDGNGAKSEDGSDEGRRRGWKWVWAFALLVEDASPGAAEGRRQRMILHVAEQEAEFLLNMDAQNLRRNQQALAQLREKLFILWGDLEERKTQEEEKGRGRGEDQEKQADGSGDGAAATDEKPPQSKPFNCLIREYGVKVKGKWERKFCIAGTTIAT